jgi:hypothetical protein
VPERHAASILRLMFRDADTQLCLKLNWRIYYSQSLPPELIATILKMMPDE